jgi:hypothetical protein
MNFVSVTEQVLRLFGQESIRFALIGGYAAGLWGVSRSTVDMDFLLHRDDLEKLDRIMAAIGYELRFRSGNVSHFTSGSSPAGEMDFLHAFRPHSLAMLDRAVELKIFGGKLLVKTLIPEDLIGLKIQAIANDPRRERWDLRDIEALLKIHGRELDWSLVGEYFAIFDQTPLFDQLRKRYS